MSAIGEPFGTEFVLADIAASPGMYQMLGRVDVYEGSFPYDLPNVDSSTFKTGANRAKKVVRRWVQNVKGSALTTGMVVIIDITGGSYEWGVDTTTTANVKRELVAGIVFGDCQTDGTIASPASIADDSIFDVGVYGIFRVRCISTVAEGDGLGTSTTAGVLDTTTTAGAILGIALSAAATEDSGTTYFCYALINGIPY